MAEHPNVTRLRKGFEIRTRAEFNEDDVAYMNDLFDDAIIWHGSGSGQFSEGAEGKENVWAMFGRVAEETEGTFKMTVDEIFADGIFGVVTTRVTADRGERHHEWKEVDLFRMNPNGTIAEFWGIPDDQDALDAFFND